LSSETGQGQIATPQTRQGIMPNLTIAMIMISTRALSRIMIALEVLIVETGTTMRMMRKIQIM
jgi:hypothetical protein